MSRVLCSCHDGAVCRACQAIHDRLRREYPSCVFCSAPCVAGQKDADGNPAHLSCAENTADANRNRINREGSTT